MDIYSRYHKISDERWLQLLLSTDPSGHWLSRLPKRLARLGKGSRDLPTWPAEDIQKQFVGSSGTHALREGFQFYKLVKQQCSALGRPLSSATRILDFGCGWGRVARFFLKDVPAENFVGVDVDPEIVQICRETIQFGTFETVPPNPPTQFPDGSFDVIYAYSVLSHLAEVTHLKWVQEFARLLRDGGLVFATTQKRSFIEFCNNLTENQLVSSWHRSLATAFRPLDVSLAKYDRGEFVYSPTGGGGVRNASFYGEAAVSESFVDEHWRPFLTKLAFDPVTLPQALIIAQKAG